jgi:hypothetical protein
MPQSTTNVVHVEFLVNKMALEQIYLRVIRVIAANHKLSSAPHSFTAAPSHRPGVGFVSGFSPLRPEFNPRAVHVGIVVE